LTQLVDALTQADLVGALSGDGPFTVFAPTNDAFDAISSTVAGLTKEQLAMVLEYHVISGAEAKSTDLTDMEVLLPLFSGHSLGVDLEEEGRVRIVGENNAVTVTMADVLCTNGVVHIVDAVLVPNLALAATADVDSTCQEEGTEVSSHNEGLAKCCSSKSRTNNRCRGGVCEIHRYCCYYCPGDMEVGEAIAAPMSIVETAQATPELTQLVDALTQADLVGALSGDGPFTVFAPTNDAFDAISSTVAGLTKEQLAMVLEYHVISGAEAKSTDLTDMEVLLPLFSGHSLGVDLEEKGRVRIVGENNAVTVTLADVLCTNGVVHIVDAVLVPNLALAATADVDSTCQEEGTEVSSHNEGLRRGCCRITRTNNRCRGGVCDIHRYCCYYCPGDLEVV